MFWLNGEYCTEASINALDRGFLLGDGVFETVYLKNGAPVFLAAHLARMARGLTALNIRNCIPSNIGAILMTLARESALNGPHMAARITVTRGPSGRGLLFPAPGEQIPTCLASVSGMPLRKTDAPITLVVSSHRRAEASIAARHKTLNYLDNVLARNEADMLGADEAIMVNMQGRVACASAANIFVIDRAGDIATPARGEGALDGIVRDLLLTNATEIGVNMNEQPVGQDALETGMCFLTNSLIGVRRARLREVEKLASGVQVEIFNKLQSWYESHLLQHLTESAPGQ